MITFDSRKFSKKGLTPVLLIILFIFLFSIENLSLFIPLLISAAIVFFIVISLFCRKFVIDDNGITIYSIFRFKLNSISWEDIERITTGHYRTSTLLMPGYFVQQHLFPVIILKTGRKIKFTHLIGQFDFMVNISEMATRNNVKCFTKAQMVENYNK